MLYYLDTNIVIYAVEGQPPFQRRARNHIANLENAGHRFVVSDLTWAECQVLPLRTGNAPLLLDYHRFFTRPDLTTVSVTTAACRRASMIRAVYNYGLTDSLHLAIAVENRLDRFLSNDNRLAGFPDLPLDVLP